MSELKVAHDDIDGGKSVATSSFSGEKANKTGGRLSSGARELLAGMASGVACKVIEYPFDTVKVLQQTNSGYNGAWDCLKVTWRQGGIQAFYRGLTSPLLGAMAENATLFVSYGWAKKVLNVDEDKATLANPVPVWKYLAGGAASGVTVAFVLTPVELIKCRMQVQSGLAATSTGKRYSGSLDCAKQILREEGLAGMWRGNGACLAREIPGNVAWFGCYELVLRGIQLAKGYDRKSDVPLAASAVAGSAAGVCYWAIPFPADTVKSKLQTDPRFAGLPFQQVFSTILKEDGVRGLYRGIGITAARAAPSHGMLFFAYETVERWLRQW
eukprot:CAMPEP_0206455264 /NCGR_PEP_ID=MMETSP0324_2-20121206/21649_1 /ASSEMBLY_ACC=CAM_ASM_000836 /TAXON_ID=2866 /ORGANISM="Crypthecodinium cohnii, Strain Seligo" /LENGTH=326 /DNA_ID=CAMNT_0053925935 /DNA_START=140 /DNA_END=1120 /DNA_ORIENTATION=+